MVSESQSMNLEFEFNKLYGVKAGRINSIQR